MGTGVVDNILIHNYIYKGVLNMKNTKYLLFTIVLFGYLIYSQELLGAIREHDSQYLTMLLPYIRSPIYIILGFMLGLEHLIYHVIKKEGRLTCEYVQLLFIGLPALIFSFYTVIIIHNLWPLASLSILHRPFIFEESFIISISIILGFSIITSLKRV